MRIRIHRDISKDVMAIAIVVSGLDLAKHPELDKALRVVGKYDQTHPDDDDRRLPKHRLQWNPNDS
jgi:hypothetical protein